MKSNFQVLLIYFSEISSKSAYLEYLAIGDFSGQVTLMEVSKLFSEKVLNIF
jgi:hypothetical protein